MDYIPFNDDSNGSDYEYINDFISILLRYAKEHSIRVKWANLHSHTPPATNPKRRIIVMNLKWHNTIQLPLQLAHEMEHILHSDDEFSILYFTTGMKDSMEREANIDAVYLLIDIYMYGLDNPKNANYVSFSKAFGIPSKLDSVVKEAMNEYEVNHHYNI